MKQKVLLLDLHRYKAKYYESLGLLSIRCHLENNNIQVELVDYTCGHIDFDYLNKINPLLIAIPLYYYPIKEQLDELINIKDKLPETKIVVGGYIPTMIGRDLMEENKSIDFVIKGEGEIALLELVLTLLNKETTFGNIKGLLFRDGLTIVGSSEFADRVDLSKIKIEKRDVNKIKNIGYVYIEAGRGCISNCIYCNYSRLNNKWRGRSIKDIVDEIEFITKTYKLNYFSFIDGSLENPHFDLRRTAQIAKEIIVRDLKIYYYAAFRVNAFINCDLNDLGIIYQSGLVGIFLGIESFDDNELRFLGKKYTGSQVAEVMDTLSNYLINVDIGFINVTPTATIGSLKINNEYLHKYKLNRYFIYTWKLKMIKGTALSNQMIERGELLTEVSPIEYNYTHKDIKIRRIFSIIRDQGVLKLRSELKIMNKLTFLCTEINALIYKHIREAEYNTDYETSKNLQLLHEDMRRIYKELDNNNYNWYKTVIEMVENDCTNKEIEKATQIYLNKNVLMERFDKLRKMELQLYKYIYISDQKK